MLGSQIERQNPAKPRSRRLSQQNLKQAASVQTQFAPDSGFDDLRGHSTTTGRFGFVPKRQAANDGFIRGLSISDSEEDYCCSWLPPPRAKIRPSGIVIWAWPIRLLSGFLARTPLT